MSVTFATDSHKIILWPVLACFGFVECKQPCLCGDGLGTQIDIVISSCASWPLLTQDVVGVPEWIWGAEVEDSLFEAENSKPTKAASGRDMRAVWITGGPYWTTHPEVRGCLSPDSRRSNWTSTEEEGASTLCCSLWDVSLWLSWATTSVGKYEYCASST